MMRLAIVLVVLLMAGWYLLPGKDAEQKTGFAENRGGEAPAPAPFDGERAMKYLKSVCDIGPRMSGTPGMTQQQELIKRHFEKLGIKPQFQTFTARQTSAPKAVEMTNMIVSWYPERNRRVIICSHYDTRPIADQEPDPRKWKEKFVSANDGGSGVAFLMELGHHMKELKTTVGVDFVFFDGEEYIFDRDRDKYFFGSEHFAQTWKKSKPRPDYAAGVLLDMIAGKNVRFPVEGTSALRAGRLATDLWTLARDLKCNVFIDRVGEQVLDDHLALLNAGIPAIDIIDFEYPHWHRLNDLPENCAPEGMMQVSKVLTSWLQRVK